MLHNTPWTVLQPVGTAPPGRRQRWTEPGCEPLSSSSFGQPAPLGPAPEKTPRRSELAVHQGSVCPLQPHPQHMRMLQRLFATVYKQLTSIDCRSTSSTALPILFQNMCVLCLPHTFLCCFL